MELTDKSCSAFLQVLAGKDAVPGGGGASALAGAVGMALGHMVGALTLGKKKYADVEADIQVLMEKAEALQQQLLLLVDQDAEAFAPLAAAYGMPAETAEQKAQKAQVMESALKDACMVPLTIMEKCCEAIDLQAEFAEKGSRLAVSDAGTGVILCKSALQGASLNVFINTKSMENRQLAEELEAKADAMLLEYTVRADAVYASVFSQLRKRKEEV